MLQRASRILRAPPWRCSEFRMSAFPLPNGRRLHRAYGTTKVSDPLRILFCGSDDFSGASLKALNEEKQKNSDLIQSIDVVVRPGKPTGRGLKEIREPPLKALAAELGLPIHERDTFTGWNMPEATNLIVAVSFGLFVPPRLLHAAKYGGLNVHPSLLPYYRGAAPLHRTLLDTADKTGVSLQTLDDKEFDRGIILARQILKWDNGSEYIPEGCTVQQLQDAAAALGAQLLVEGLRDGLHVPPLRDVVEEDPDIRIPLHLPYAPKITSWDRQPPRNQFDAKSLARRQRVIGPLWFMAEGQDGELKRIIIEQVDLVHCEDKARTKDVQGEAERAVSFEQDDRKRYGKWVCRKLRRFCQSKQGEPAEMKSKPIRYWTREGDDAIYYSPGNPPFAQTVAYARIPLLKLEGEKAKPAAQVALPFSMMCRLPSTLWRRRRQWTEEIDYVLHVETEVQLLLNFTRKINLLAAANGDADKLAQTVDVVSDEMDRCNYTLAEINWDFTPRNERLGLSFRKYKC
ncbi:hypothetical protein DL768_008428 [Monosporascus sp. mg162]|nr:hypothetical protein DL768_008428 [Monosporascus sp. mg162]